jgi:TP901-1 family phage major tail protein
MSKIAGVTVLLSVKQGENYVTVGGQSGATLNRTSNIIEVTSKDANGWQESIAGVKGWGIDCDGFLVEGDTAYEALETAWINGDKVECKIALPSGKTYTGLGFISEFPNEYPSDDAVTFSLSITGTGALTITPPPAP